MQIKKEILRGLEMYNLKIQSGPSLSFCHKADVFWSCLSEMEETKHVWNE